MSNAKTAIEFVAKHLHDCEIGKAKPDPWDVHMARATAAITALQEWTRQENSKPRFSENQEGGILGQRVYVPPTPVLQDWVVGLPLMQQTVLLTAIRGPDSTPKYTAAKYLLRWFRRCVLLSAMDKRILDNPVAPSGGSFTGPSFEANNVYSVENWEEGMETIVVTAFLKSMDGLPLHWVNHFRHAVEIVGYKHPVPRVRQWWNKLYVALVNDLHLHPESMADMDMRLSDNREAWLARNNPATVD